MTYDQHQTTVAAIRAAAAANDWPVWVEPDFFAGGTWKVVRADGDDVALVADGLSLLDAIAAGAAASTPPFPTVDDAPAERAPTVREQRRERVLDVLRATGGGMSMADIAAALGQERSPALKKTVQDLVGRELVVAVGNTRSRRYHPSSPAQEAAPTAGPDPQPMPADPGPADPDPDVELPGAPEPVAPPYDPISPRVRREVEREERASAAREAAAGTPQVDPVLRRRIGLYFDAHGRTDTLAGIAAKLNLTGDAVRPTVHTMVEHGALEVIPGATPTRYRAAEARAA